MPSMQNGDGGVSTPLFENLKPLIPILEAMSVIQIRNEVIGAAEISGVSDMKISKIKEIFLKLGENKNEVMMYVVNLTLAAEGLKSIPSNYIRKNQ